MPSRARGKGYYKRSGGAYRKSSRGKGYRKVGYGRGTHSKRNPRQDRARRARKNDSTPNHLGPDSPWGY